LYIETADKPVKILSYVFALFHSLALSLPLSSRLTHRENGEEEEEKRKRFDVFKE